MTHQPARRGDYRDLEVRPGRVLSEVGFVVRFVWQHPANRRRRLRALARATRFQLSRRLRGSTSLAPLGRRSRILVPPHVPSASRALYANPPDWPEMVVWQRVLGPGDLFIDVGANVGIYTVFAAETGAEVIAIEPGERAVEMLRQNLALNGYEAEVLVAAVADRPGTMQVTVDFDMGNRLALAAGDETLTTVPVAVRTLDEIIGDRVVAGVKIDVEGAERLVLEGTAEALADHRIKLLQLEWNDTSVALLGEDRTPVAELLRGHGYDLFRPSYDTAELVPEPDPGFGHDVFARPR